MPTFQDSISQYEPLVGDANKGIDTVSGGSTGQVLTHQGASAEPVFADAPTGGLTLFDSVTASGASNVEFTDLETGRYILFIDNMTLTSSGQNMKLTVSNNNGTSYASTNYNSDIFYYIYGSTTQRSGGSSSTSNMFVAQNSSTSTSQTYNATINLSNINSADYCFIEGDAVGYSPIFTGFTRVLITGNQVSLTSVDAIKLTPSSGNVTGNFYLYKVNYS